jgi:hypothetical protein
VWVGAWRCLETNPQLLVPGLDPTPLTLGVSDLVFLS